MPKIEKGSITQEADHSKTMHIGKWYNIAFAKTQLNYMKDNKI